MTPHGEPTNSLDESILEAQNEVAGSVASASSTSTIGFVGALSRPVLNSANLGEEDLAFSVIGRQGRRAFEFASRLLIPAEARQELTAHAGNKVKFPKCSGGVDVIDEAESACWAMRFGDRDRLVELSDR